MARALLLLGPLCAFAAGGERAAVAVPRALVLIPLQDPNPETDVGADYRRTLASLRAPSEAGESPSRARRVELLTAFVARHAAASAAAPELLEARCRIGTLQLLSVRPKLAIEQFDAALRASLPRQIDVRGRALYGKAQAEELRGRAAAATLIHERIASEFAGTRYADYARVALNRLRDPDVPSIGRPAPEAGPWLDLAGKSHSLLGLRGAPALLLFFSPEDPAGLDRVARTCSAARAAGLPWSQMLAFGLDDDQAALARATKRMGLRTPIVPNRSGFLDPTVLRYRVTALPATYLIAADGTLLARDLPPDRLRAVLSKLK